MKSKSGGCGDENGFKGRGDNVNTLMKKVGILYKSDCLVGTVRLEST